MEGGLLFEDEGAAGVTTAVARVAEVPDFGGILPLSAGTERPAGKVRAIYPHCAKRATPLRQQAPITAALA